MDGFLIFVRSVVMGIVRGVFEVVWGSFIGYFVCRVLWEVGVDGAFGWMGGSG